jgi:hypothetical protein
MELTLHILIPTHTTPMGTTMQRLILSGCKRREPFAAQAFQRSLAGPGGAKKQSFPPSLATPTREEKSTAYFS